MQYVFELPDESSAKNIDLDVSSDQIKLNSKNYEFDKKFTDIMLNEDSIKCKFSKKNKTLTLTVDKIEIIN